MWKSDWSAGLSNNYDAIAAANALHWFDVARGARLFRDVFRLLRPGGAFVFLEAASAEPSLLKQKHANRYDPETWERFWARVNALLGYDHTVPRHQGPRPYRRRWHPPSESVRFLESAGFRTCDVLLRSAEKLLVASAKP